MKKEKSRGLDMLFVFEREEKCVENVQAERKTQKNDLFFGLEGA